MLVLAPVLVLAPFAFASASAFVAALAPVPVLEPEPASFEFGCPFCTEQPDTVDADEDMDDKQMRVSAADAPCSRHDEMQSRALDGANRTGTERQTDAAAEREQLVVEVCSS